ncbi:hypothetical protein EF910_02155 [Streptomyces sp. WAC07149]|uniref:hypothetical protein n=1 Tax=Streptomyces sp. WAC07149 TaxID=2487425 RepID=UPI000F7889B9|nr:hypothetical protein [Streptomyces sp. WAC07149]RST09030.1 hypothetical protein EF910_02155 [Streptomyces sp. WAC07149]
MPVVHPPVGIPIEQISDVNYMRIIYLQHGSVNDRRLLEIYTGWVQSGKFAVGGVLHKSQQKIFLPTAANQVKLWQDPPTSPQPDFIVSSTVAAGVTAIESLKEGHVVAIDGASVALERNEFVGVDGNLRTLVLTVPYGLVDAVLLSFSYQVNVLSRLPQEERFDTVPGDSKPKVEPP